MASHVSGADERSDNGSTFGVSIQIICVDTSLSFFFTANRRFTYLLSNRHRWEDLDT